MSVGDVTTTNGAPERLSLGVAARLARYLQVLTQAKKEGKETVSSQELSEWTHVNSTQIRRDLSGFGKFGKRGVGYNVDALVSQIRKILRTAGLHNIALFGAGPLGRAGGGSDIFADHGVGVVALFDPDPGKGSEPAGDSRTGGRSAAKADEVLARSVAGELISSEIEIRSDKGDTFAAAVASQREARARLFRLAWEHDAMLMATGTHPWSPWWEQEIIDTEHYKRLERDLGYVARRNNTFSLHVHVGLRGADRAVAVCNRLRQVLPELLAVSANSPFLDGFDSGLASARSQIFTKTFPRCGIPPRFASFTE